MAKHLILLSTILLLWLAPTGVQARDGLWFSSKFTTGYNQVYIAAQVDMFQSAPVRTRIELGYILEPHDNLDIVPRYIWQLPRGETQFRHIFGVTLKLTFP